MIQNQKPPPPTLTSISLPPLLQNQNPNPNGAPVPENPVLRAPDENDDPALALPHSLTIAVAVAAAALRQRPEQRGAPRTGLQPHLPLRPYSDGGLQLRLVLRYRRQRHGLHLPPPPSDPLSQLLLQV